jgi:hypothetical protein
MCSANEYARMSFDKTASKQDSICSGSSHRATTLGVRCLEQLDRAGGITVYARGRDCLRRDLPIVFAKLQDQHHDSRNQCRQRDEQQRDVDIGRGAVFDIPGSHDRPFENQREFNSPISKLGCGGVTDGHRCIFGSSVDITHSLIRLNQSQPNFGNVLVPTE